MSFPLLTEADPAVSSEGALDPLGLFAIADSLAVRLVPGVRERQSHPRFLTAMAVTAVVCSGFEEDAVARDGVSEPWQVFEWYIVEGLVRTAEGSGSTTGLPGSLKASHAIKAGVPLSASRYLKTPTVFGFHGVYRVLAEDLDVIQGNSLGEKGYELVTAWAAEQGLDGFLGGTIGQGSLIRKQLASAVEEGLEKGAVARTGGWSAWAFINNHLHHLKCGKREASFISSLLLNSEVAYRPEVVKFLISPKGQRLWEDPRSERLFHQGLMEVASPELNDLLKAILTCETFARLLQDAFDDCLFVMSKRRGNKTSLKELAETPCVDKAHARLAELYYKLSDQLKPFGESSKRLEKDFSPLAEKTSSIGWVELLLEHHRRNQRKKPPNGKNPWFDRFDDGSVMIRPGYLQEKGGRNDDTYVHAYRTGPLWTFANDLKMV